MFEICYAPDRQTKVSLFFFHALIFKRNTGKIKGYIMLADDCRHDVLFLLFDCKNETVFRVFPNTV